MKNTIWKYPLVPRVPVNIPQDAKILTVQIALGDGSPYLWALVNPDLPLVERKFIYYGTGKDLPENPGTYIGTFQNELVGLNYVWHVFEI